MSRFFFAVNPDTSVKEKIVKCRSQLPLYTRMTSKENLHMTLLFLGRLTVNQQQNIIRQTAHIVCLEFEIYLNHSGYFANSKTVWLGVEIIPNELLELHNQLVCTADNCHLAIKQQSYKPHVTLARKASFLSPQTITPISWSVTDFVLFESIDTARCVQYHAVQYFTCKLIKKGKHQ